MTTSSSQPAAKTGANGTYIALAVTGVLFLSLAAPRLLATVGLISQDNLQVLGMFVGLGLVLPTAASLLVTAILSLKCLVRGSTVIRVRLVAWWVVGVGGISISQVLASTPGFNPYLGTPQPTFGAGDALLVICLGFCALMPYRWRLLVVSEHNAH